MKSLLLKISLFLLPIFSFAQTEIKLQDVSSHIGDSVTVMKYRIMMLSQELKPKKDFVIQMGLLA